MKYIRRVIIAVALLTLVADPLHASTKVYLLGGQSNMAGRGGYDKACPAPYNQAQASVKFWNYDTEPVAGSVSSPGVGNGWVSLQTGYGYLGGEFGPEVSFGYRLHELFPSDSIYLVKLGFTSTSLASDWNPQTGATYSLFKNRADAAIKNLTKAGDSPTIGGMIWMQGEADARDATYAANYRTNLANFIEAVRNDFDSPNMRFVLGRIRTGPDTDPPGGNTTVRDAQAAIVGDVGNVYWIDTDSLSLAYPYHFGTQGQIELGTMFANEFIHAPEPSSFALLLCGGATAVIFALRVRSRNHTGVK